MKGILQLLGIIFGVFFFLGVLPVAFPPSALIIYPLISVLGIYIGVKVGKQCNSKED